MGVKTVAGSDTDVRRRRVLRLWALGMLYWLWLTSALGARSSPSAASESAEALLSLASHQHDNGGDTVGAVNSLRGAIELSPTYGRAYLELGKCLHVLATSVQTPKKVALQRAAEAEAAFRTAITLSGDTHTSAPIGMAYYCFASLQSHRGRIPEAEELLRIGLRLEPLGLHYGGLAKLAMGFALPRTSPFGCLTHLVQPRNAFDSKAQAPMNTEQSVEVEALLRNGIAQVANGNECSAKDVEGDFRLDLAFLLSSRGKYEEASREMRRAIQLAPSRTDYHAAMEVLVRQVDEMEASWLARPPASSPSSAQEMDSASQKLRTPILSLASDARTGHRDGRELDLCRRNDEMDSSQAIKNVDSHGGEEHSAQEGKSPVPDSGGPGVDSQCGKGCVAASAFQSVQDSLHAERELVWSLRQRIRLLEARLQLTVTSIAERKALGIEGPDGDAAGSMRSPNRQDRAWRTGAAELGRDWSNGGFVLDEQARTKGEGVHTESESARAGRDVGKAIRDPHKCAAGACPPQGSRAARERGGGKSMVRVSDSSREHGVEQAILSRGRMCLIYLLDRAGGYDAAIASVQRQTLKPDALIVLDQLTSPTRRRNARRLASAANIRMEVVDIPTGPWRARNAWRAARDACMVAIKTNSTPTPVAEPHILVLGLARHGVILPSRFIEFSLRFHTDMRVREDANEESTPANPAEGISQRKPPRLPLLTLPLWSFLPPPSEVDGDAALAPNDSSSFFTPPLDVHGYSRRGWQLEARVPPAASAAARGKGSTRLKKQTRVPAGVFSISIDNAMELDMLPADPQRLLAHHAAAKQTLINADDQVSGATRSDVCKWGKAQGARAELWLADISLLAEWAPFGPVGGGIGDNTEATGQGDACA